MMRLLTSPIKISKKTIKIEFARKEAKLINLFSMSLGSRYQSSFWGFKVFLDFFFAMASGVGFFLYFSPSC